MTKQRKLGLALLIAIALSGGAWLTYSVTSGSTPADKGYELYLSGDTDGAFRYFFRRGGKGSAGSLCIVCYVSQWL